MLLCGQSTHDARHRHATVLSEVRYSRAWRVREPFGHAASNAAGRRAPKDFLVSEASRKLDEARRGRVVARNTYSTIARMSDGS
jgi:hypothetical protein